MKYIYYGLNIILILTIIFIGVISVNYGAISINKDDKALKSEVLKSNRELVQPRVDENTQNIQNTEVAPVANNVQPVIQQPQTAPVVSDVLETQSGAMSAYILNCSGCTGNLASRITPSDGSHTYNDSKYGNVRIVAGDYSYPFGSIVRVKGSNLGEFYAIVLDRGGAIGKGKKFMFDLLYPSYREAINYGTEYNLTFEIVRYGF